MDSAARPIAMLYLVSGYGPSLTEEGRAEAVDAAWPVFGGRDPREVYDAHQRELDDNGEAGVKGHLWRHAEEAAVAAVARARGAPPDGLRLEVF
jgi:hypothetical protein